MANVMTARMSSKGQGVLPEALRQMYGWGSGTAFTILAYKGAIIMQRLKSPTDEEIAAEFEEAFAESRRPGPTPPARRRGTAQRPSPKRSVCSPE